MYATMLVQSMMQTLGDGGIHDTCNNVLNLNLSKKKKYYEKKLVFICNGQEPIIKTLSKR
jgi:hypothetical protein